MKSWVLAVGLLAAAFVPAASAADVGDDRDDGAYNDPRYRTPPQNYNNRDDDYDDDGPPPAARRFSGPAPYAGRCAQSEDVRHRLSRMGWQDFHGGQPQGNDLVTLRARRPNGRLFELTLQRCSGEIVEARPLELRPFGPYAFNPPRRDYYEDRRDDFGHGYRDRRWWHRGY